ncbi:MAG: hydrogenase expression/formation protein HypE [Chloroflexi bacterium]|nr:hydrogenase expression/formation protein HypE [Chloroflexota bacterium]
MAAGKDNERVLVAHGSGGRLSQELIQKLFLPSFNNSRLNRLDDFAIVSLPPGRQPCSLAFTTDSFVVKPLFFPGGNIGKLSVCGTVNDLAMSGARPLALSASFIVEEGFLLADLARIAQSMQQAAEEAGVEIVAGDTKVVEAGGAYGVFITTTGLGVIPPGVAISGSGARPADKIVLSGSLGDHGIAVLSEREGLRFRTAIQSDCAPLNHLVEAMLEVCPAIHSLRDPTRGGLATILNELAEQSGVAMRIHEEAIPVHDGVRAACELLGFDPLYVANEGKLVAIVPAAKSEAVVEKMRQQKYGREAAIIGEVLAGPAGRVTLTTTVGGSRLVDALAGELLPRIC